ncbi:MAG: aminoglycoside phosphotransferase family protein [Desulfobacterales bacterium]|nr:aminoglycoside phosphotransferase family protein [Desulfobacterales bacterium]MDJ0913058.1 aminoglycoside phosphotransferase family protein [Desulfobacterales bacterium]
MELMQAMLPEVVAYIKKHPWDNLPFPKAADIQITPLAQGEYNLNYLLQTAHSTLVVRVNVGTQIDRDDQILYEYQTLKLLEPSGVTPRALFVDDSRQHLANGILLMQYLPGKPLDYARDLDAAAWLFSRTHQVGVAKADNHLIQEDAALTLIYTECQKLLQHYFESELADPDISAYLKELIHWADGARQSESYYQQDPWPCIINTEVNSGNFIVNRVKNSIHLVDWEMPRWGDPSQDLCHFYSPLTTLWKTDFQMNQAQKRAFIQAYARHIHDKHLQNTLMERVRLRDPFVYLRGISWSAMGWVAYQTDYAGVKNPDTWATLQRYMDLKFIRQIFDPFLTSLSK